MTLLFTEEVDLKALNEIKNTFRQHINNRRNETQTDLIMNEQLIENIKDLKVLSYDILRKFMRVNSSLSHRVAPDESEKFTDLDEFNRYISNQQEILNSELWKMDVLVGYLLQE